VLGDRRVVGAAVVRQQHVLVLRQLGHVPVDAGGEGVHPAELRRAREDAAQALRAESAERGVSLGRAAELLALHRDDPIVGERRAERVR